MKHLIQPLLIFVTATVLLAHCRRTGLSTDATTKAHTASIADEYKQIRQEVEKSYRELAPHYNDPGIMQRPEGVRQLALLRRQIHEKLNVVLRAFEAGAIGINSAIDDLSTFFGDDFPERASFVPIGSGNWLTVDIVPNRLTQDPKHMPLGWMVWFMLDKNDRVTFYCIADERQVLRQNMSPLLDAAADSSHKLRGPVAVPPTNSTKAK